MFTRSESCCLFGVFSLVVARHYFGTLMLTCSPCSWLMRPHPPIPFLLSSFSVTQNSSPLFSSFHIGDVWMSATDRASGLDTKHRGQLFALPTEGGSVKILCCWKELKITDNNLVHLWLWALNAIFIAVLTHQTLIFFNSRKSRLR